MKASLTQPAVIGGLVGGVLSALPLIAGGNLCCCLWIVSGGAVAAYVLQQNQSLPIAPGDGALVGLLAGVIGAFVYLVLSIPINLLMTPMERVLFERLSETMSNMPPEFREVHEELRVSRCAPGARFRADARSRCDLFHDWRLARRPHLPQEGAAGGHRPASTRLG